MVKYWIAVASKEHVHRGIKEGIAQVCHGKGGPLKKMKGGDWLIYYSPTEKFGHKESCRRFTAIGQIKPDEPYQFEMSPDFIPWRRNVKYLSSDEVAIEIILDKLSFIQNKQRWGYPFRFGCFEIPESDFKFIATKMGVDIHAKTN